MSFHAELMALASSLGDLLALDDVAVPESELAIIASLRSDVLTCLTGIYCELTGIKVNSLTSWTLADLERDPVPILARMLARHPRDGRPCDTRPSDRLTMALTSHAARAWQAAARHAVLAHAEAASLMRSPEERPWPEIRDLAAISRTIPALDADLANVYAKAGDRDTARLLSVAATAGLRVTADEVVTVASAAARGKATLRERPRRPPAPMLVRRLSDIPAAQRNLTALLCSSAGQISPRSATTIAAGLARSCEAAAYTARAANPRDGDGPAAGLEQALTRHAEAFAAVATAHGAVASLHSGDQRAVHQVAEITRCLRRLAASPRPARPDGVDDLCAFARALPTVTTSLRDSIEAAVRNGRWLVPNDETSAEYATWQVTNLGSARPAMLDEVERAAGSLTAGHTPHPFKHHAAAATPSRDRIGMRPGQREAPSLTD